MDAAKACSREREDLPRLNSRPKEVASASLSRLFSILLIHRKHKEASSTARSKRNLQSKGWDLGELKNTSVV